MALTPGTRLGVYEVTAQIGVGGMGEVYRATDTRLKRQVAIKILPPSFAADADRLARFQREAEVLASLNHPHIAAIYGLEDAGGVKALVMELVEGDDLSQRIARGAIPLDEALPIARQIAEALEAAHEQGIIHRDLKPANIKVREDGTVKVLDFGLAKAMAPAAGSSPSISMSPTLSMHATQAGIVLGTAAYMAPEQARGKTVDKRADIWAFGVVLFEMLAGTPPFPGEDISHVLARVIERDPDWTALPPTLSHALGTYLRRCLVKDPRQRMRDIGDVRLALEGAFETAAPQTTAPPAVAPPPSVVARVLRAVAVVLVVALGIALWGWWHASRPLAHVPQSLMRLDVDLGPDVSLGSSGGAGAILSPDGTRLAYVSQSRLFIRQLDLDQSTAKALEGTEGAVSPFFSPDGEWIAFFAQAKLMKVAVAGGKAIPVCNAGTGVHSGSWGEDGDIIAALYSNGALSRIPAARGAPTPATDLGPGEITHRWPQVLPGGKAVLFTAHTANTGFDDAQIEVMSFADHKNTPLVRGTYGRYLDSGHLIYVRRGRLFAVPFDLDRLTITAGAEWQVLEISADQTGAAQFDVSRTGTFVYRAGGEGTLLTVQELDAAGGTRPLLPTPGLYSRPRMSTTGFKLALTVSKGSGSDVVVYDLQREMMQTYLTFGGGSFDSGLFSAGSQYVVFSGPGGLWWNRVGGGKPQVFLPRASTRHTPWSFSRDGKWLAFHEWRDNGYDLWTVPVQSDESGLRPGTPEPFLRTEKDERHPAFSPNGHWLAYAQSDEHGNFDVWVRPFPDTGTGGPWQISFGGGASPVWSNGGNELFFRAVDNRIWVASYTVRGDTFVPNRAHPWSDTQLADTGIVWNYDLMPDGQHVAALMPAETPAARQASNHLTFLLNFFDEIRRRAK